MKNIILIINNKIFKDNYILKINYNVNLLDIKLMINLIFLY